MGLKFYYPLGLFLMGAVAAYAQSEEMEPVHLTFDVDNASRVVISINGEELNAIETGINEVEINPWSNLNIAASDGCTLVSVTDSAGDALTITNNSVSVFISDSVTEETYRITTASEEMVAFTIDVDNAANVAVCDHNYQRLNLSDGINSFSFSNNRFPLIISAANYGSALYKVELDGVEIPDNYGYAVTPVDGSEITVISEFPDINCNLGFVLPEGITGFFTAVTVNQEDCVDFMNGVTVKCGDSVQLYYNPYCWLAADQGTPVAIAINGVEPGWFGPGYSFVVREDTEVEVLSAEPAPMIQIEIDIDNPDNVNVYRCSDMFRDVIPLNAGTNTVELPQEYSYIVIMTVENPEDEVECRIEGIMVNGRPKNVDYYNYVEVRDLDADDVVSIFTSGYPVSKEAMTMADKDLSGAVYSVTGVKVMENPTAEGLRALPAGIYIVNGRKVCIK